MTLNRFLIVLLLLGLLCGCGISGNLRGDPGYARFQSPGIADTDRTFALSLGPLPLKLARSFVEGDPETEALLENLDAVRVYVYEVDRNPDSVRQRLRTTEQRLSADGWERAVAVREDGGLVLVMMKMGRNDSIRGMVVMSLQAEELVLVNLIGDLHPEMFNHYMAELDVETPAVAIDTSGT